MIKKSKAVDCIVSSAEENRILKEHRDGNKSVKDVLERLHPDVFEREAEDVKKYILEYFQTIEIKLHYKEVMEGALDSVYFVKKPGPDTTMEIVAQFVIKDNEVLICSVGSLYNRLRDRFNYTHLDVVSVIKQLLYEQLGISKRQVNSMKFTLIPGWAEVLDNPE